MPISDLFAQTPKGKNSIENSLELYDEKTFYYDEVYPGGDLPWLDKPFDFINENPLYGKVDLNGDYIIPKYDLVRTAQTTMVAKYKNMAPVNSEENAVQVFDFVAEAFNDLKEYISSLVKTDWLSREGTIASFEAKKGFMDFEVMNRLQKEMHYFSFVSQFLSKTSIFDNKLPYKEILYNASDFTNFFLLYLKDNAKAMPFTKSGIINAFYMAPMSTGLCLEIDVKPYDDDAAKHKFLKDPNFNIYRIAARRYGFMVDRNVPWRLVADVRSLKMREYMRIAYERNIISERQGAILDSKREEITSSFPELPTIDDLFTKKSDGKYYKKPNSSFDPEKYSWNNKTLREFWVKAQEELEGAINITALQAQNYWVMKNMYNSKDPQIKPDGMPACSEGPYKTCDSRVFKFAKFFEVYYDVPYLDEVSDLQKTFYKFYISYYVQNPVIKKRVLCSPDETSQAKITVKDVELEYISEEKYGLLYTDYYWLKIYFDIKLAEGNIKLKNTDYKKHMKKIIDLSTLNHGNANNLTGFTSKDAQHLHEYEVDVNGSGKAIIVAHPDNPEALHHHEIINWIVQSAKSNCYPDCVEGAPPHVHTLNNDMLVALTYINKVVRKKMKGLDQIYGEKGSSKEEYIGNMLMAALQQEMIPSKGSLY